MTDHTQEIDRYLHRLFPICRSITGEGNRESLRILQEIAPISQYEIPSGTQVCDWIVPDEWNIRDAWIATPDGHRIVSFQESNLHIMGYSEPVEASMEWAELEPHLCTHPELTASIPFTAPLTTSVIGALLCYSGFCHH